MAPIGFDLETGPASQLFQYGPSFARIAGYTAENEEVGFTTDMQDLVNLLDKAPWIYGHGVFNFDLLALAYWYGADWENLAAKTLDTMLLDRLDYPPEARDTGGSIDKYDLDHVCARRGIPGKTDELARLSRKFGGYDQIPLDDPEYRTYLKGDVRAIQGLIDLLPKTRYAKREHRLAMLAGRMTLNGFKVDLPLLHQRIEQGEERKQNALHVLCDDYGLPLGKFEWHGRGDKKEEIWADFDSPLATLDGRKWIMELWDAFGIIDPPRTKTGRLSTSADDLQPMVDSRMLHPDLEHILELMMIVTRTRTVYQTVADHLAGPDKDRVHPLISMVQASGRWSVTSPGLTVFGKRGGRHIERAVFVPEDGYKLLSFDLRQVDMRAIAGLCQDPNYMALFGDGKDPHSEVALQLFGNADRRSDVKPINHGWNYGLGQNKMIRNGFDPKLVREFFARMQSSFPVLMEWREGIRAQGRAGELLDNGFGRMMRCNPDRAYTQAPALMGQGAAMDILKKAMLRIPREFWPWLRVPVHDEVVMVAPVEDVKEVKREMVKAMTFEWNGVPIECDASEPGDNWGQVSAK